MFEYLGKLLSLEFMPHGHCYFWEPAIVWLHVVSDALIVLAYYSIPIALVYFVRKRHDLAFNWMFVLFATFILACGTTHLLEIWNVWENHYIASGIIKLITALASIPTAILLWPLIPKALELPSPSSLAEANKALAHEVAERRRAEEEIRGLNLNLENRVRESTAQLLRESRLKDEFLATLSHELRTPLNAIVGWAQLMKTRNKPEDIEKGIEIIERNSRSQVQLIEDLLDMSRITSGKIRLDVKRIDLAQVVESAIATVEPSTEAKGIRLIKMLDSSVPAIMGDASRLQQVVWNLLSNAIKFTPRDGKIQVTVSKVGSAVHICVIDNGAGIKPDFLPYIFDRFRQDDASTTRKFGGLGLGLSIVKHLVELHGGTVRAFSPGEGLGTTIIVELPIMAAMLHDAPLRYGMPVAENDGSVTTENTDLKGLRLLVVDDEADSREVVRAILENCGATVLTASSVEAALRIISQEPVSMIISDIGMPDRDGYDLMRTIRSSSDEQVRRIPAVALTAFARAEDRTKAAIAGFNSYIAKPADQDEMIAVVSSLKLLTVN